MAAKPSFGNRLFHKLASVHTGVILLIILGVISAAGTFILQRPLTEPDKMQRAYSPEVLRWLDRLGFTDVFHAWWFALLLALVGTSIIFASVERFPKAWRLLTRPYRRPEPHFRAVLPLQQQIPISNASAGLLAAERALIHHGLKPKYVVENDEVSLYAERNRFAVLSVYVVHTSLILILLGGIVDAFFGWKGFLALTPGQTVDRLEQRDGKMRALPFSLRCDGTGQENYPDGSPKRWWSRLVVLEDGQEVLKKEIVVNDPLVAHGIRFYQSSYGSTGEVESLLLNVTPAGKSGDIKQVSLRPNQTARLDPDTTLRIIEFIPDYVIRDNQIYTRSREPVNPAVQLAVESQGKTSSVWVFPQAGQQSGDVPLKFELADLQMGAFTGMQVSYEPGQWAVWAGCVLMAIGLVMAFYCVHRRYWAITLDDGQGNLTLWVGSAADKNREHYAEAFNEMMEELRKDLASDPRRKAREKTESLASV